MPSLVSGGGGSLIDQSSLLWLQVSINPRSLRLVYRLLGSGVLVLWDLLPAMFSVLPLERGGGFSNFLLLSPGVVDPRLWIQASHSIL